jgi:hypothetical protein
MKSSTRVSMIFSRARLQVLLHDVLQVVDGVEINVVELGDFGLDIARYREIDQEHRAVLAILQRAFDRALAQDRQLARGRGNHDIGVGQACRHFRERYRLGA